MAYRRILSPPHVLSLTVSSVVARLPVGMTALAFVIFVHDRTGSFGSAGLVDHLGALALAGVLGLTVADPLIGLAITAVILKITWDSWHTVRGHQHHH